MADTHTPEQRSYNMSRIRSKWTKPEILVHNFLKGHKIRHEMHPDIDGSPDIVIKDKKIAVFIHGCFWHGCKKCYIKPSNNKAYWSKKIKGNIQRDKVNIRRLIDAGYKVIVLWEHEINQKMAWSKLN